MRVLRGGEAKERVRVSLSAMPGTELVRALRVNFPTDPKQMQEFFWPAVSLYDKEWDVIYSFEDNDITAVKSSNMAGKDFVVGFICPTTMIKHQECRGITTSVVDDHLRVIWDEIRWWVEESSYPWDRERKGVLLAANGGPLIFNHRDIRMDTSKGYSNKSYLRGMVSETGEKLSGHHAKDMTFLIVDEASSMNDLIMTFAERWMKKCLLIGNPNDCANRYRKICDQGDLADPTRPGKFHHKVVRIRAEDSPNVKLALEQIKQGREPTNEVVVPGVMMWENGTKGYRYRRQNWDEIQQCVGLDGEFYQGKGLYLITKEMIEDAIAYAASRPPPAFPRWLGIDTAEGGDDTSWVLIDRHGVLQLTSLKTRDTNVVFGKTLAMIQEHQIAGENVLFDRGGGGTWVADRLRAMEYKVRTVDFGTIKHEPQRHMRQFTQKTKLFDEKGGFDKRRSELYWSIHELLHVPLTTSDDPDTAKSLAHVPQKILSGRQRFALPMPMCEELARQLRVVPLKYDELGRFKLIPKQNPNDPDDPDTFRYLLGRSPDQADAFGLSVWGMTNKPARTTAGTS